MANSITSSSAVITWTTSAPSDSQVEYGRTAAYGGLTTNATLVTNHLVTLANLAPRARYYYRVKSGDAAGNLAVSSDFTFKTAAGRGIGKERQVMWTNIVNATLTGTTIEKTSGCEWCEATAVSAQLLSSGNGYLEVPTLQMDKNGWIGLMRSDRLASVANIDYAIGICAAGRLSIRELGTNRTETTCQPEDIFRVAVDAGAVKYYKNGMMIYQSSVASTQPLVVAVALSSPNASVTDAMIGTTRLAVIRPLERDRRLDAISRRSDR